jgi:hypothetical protein
MRAVEEAGRDDGCVKAVYPGDGDGDPKAMPSVYPETESGVDVTSFTLEVDGEVFELRADRYGGTDYCWLTGPNPGYGFSLSPTPNVSLEKHRENIRGFLAQIDPTTGYLGED